MSYFVRRKRGGERGEKIDSCEPVIVVNELVREIPVKLTIKEERYLPLALCAILNCFLAVSRVSFVPSLVGNSHRFHYLECEGEEGLMSLPRFQSHH